MSATPEIRGYAVLRDYPLRLWARQREHYDSLIREFQLLLVGEGSAESAHHAPRRLVELADMITSSLGAVIEAINAERQAALDRGLDRMDSRIPLVEGIPVLLAQIEAVMVAVDEYCASGEMLVLPRSAELLALQRWTRDQIITQYEGGEPTPWPGPF
jgi:hypothetical protein